VTMAPASDVEPVPALVGCLVLVVEDDVPLRQLFKLQLCKTPGLCVETAADGEEAVRLARELHPDVILMDIVMPVVDGFEAMRRLMEDEATARIPVIAVTGAAFDARRIRELGFDGCLFKPTTTEGMIEEIVRVLQRFGRV
jgi:CheY-like chemotaxis protein